MKTLCGFRIIEDPTLIELGPLVTVQRTWQERLYDWPWTPWQKTREERHWVPSTKAYLVSPTTILTHPSMAARLIGRLSIPNSPLCVSPSSAV